jgi:hypothetical protein
MKKSVVLLVLLASVLLCDSAFALPGDPPLWGGSCDKEKFHPFESPDFPVPVSLVHKMIREERIKLLRTKLAPYIEINSQTGKEAYRFKYQPQIDAALREVDEWERRVKDKAEKYMEVDPCPDGMGLVIRSKYADLIW